MGSAESIIGEVDSSEPTEEEKKVLMKYNDLYSRFHLNPTHENYMKIRCLDKVLLKCHGKKYKMYLWAISQTYPDLAEFVEEGEDYTEEVKRLLSPSTPLTAGDLDNMWNLYYATGDPKFPNRIKQVTTSTRQHPIVKGAAAWSYKSHIEQGLLKESEQ